MPAHSFQCPSCGAPLLPRGSAAVIRCPHCQTSVIVPEELRQDSSAAQWNTLLFDNFMANEDNHWLVGNHTSEYFDPVNRVIADGRYHWEAKVSRANGISKVWLGDYQVSDFHLIVNSKHILGARANSAWGVIFRVEDGQWRDVVDWTRTGAIKPNGVNQLEVIAREAHFIFLINGQIVSEVDDDRFTQGLVGLAIEGYAADEKITFDFLDFTLRAAS